MEQKTVENEVSQQPHQQLHEQLRGSFSTVYLTMLSIIQGVALTDLASIVISGYEHFAPVQWLMIAINFFLIIIVWNHYMADSITMNWIPGFSDSILPFSFGAIEMFLNHALPLGTTAWLIAWSVFFAGAMIGARFMIWKARRETVDLHLLHLFVSRQTGYIWQGLIGLACFLLLALGSAVWHSSVTNEGEFVQRVLGLGIVLVVAVWVVLIARSAIQYWHDVTGYARTGRKTIS